MSLDIPSRIGNWVGGEEVFASTGEVFDKLDPATGKPVCEVARSSEADVDTAVRGARAAQAEWAARTPVARGDALRELTLAMRAHRSELASIVHRETGKSAREALGETDAAIEMGFFVAGEGRRLYGKTTTSAVPNRTSLVVRQPVGVAGLIIAANTPIANVAWKIFPALLCGNAAVLKAAEDTPVTAWAVAKLAAGAGLPPGVLQTIQGLGEEAGAPLAAHPGVDLVSFTGSCEVGRLIQKAAGPRLARVCLELGGKNPLIVCDDADLELAARWTALSAFSNAGQRCAAGSRIIVFDGVYDDFRDLLVRRTAELRVGTSDEDDLGPVINESQLQNMVAAVARARAAGARVLVGGDRLTGAGYAGGFFMAPTVLEGVAPDAEISRSELFGPITCLYRVRDFHEAVALADDNPFGLTASIHTRDVHRAMTFLGSIRAGVAVVNGGTYGSEPHMPFGGLRDSGNGAREAGAEAIDVYSEWKTIYINHDPTKV